MDQQDLSQNSQQHDSAVRYGGLLERLHQDERSVVERIRHRPIIARDINELHDDRLTFGQRMADELAKFAGSWIFILSFLELIGL